MAAVITFDEIFGHANIVLGTAKLALARLQRRSPFLAGLIVDFGLFILHRELVKMVKGVSSIEPDLVSKTLAGQFLANHKATREVLLPLLKFLRGEGHWFERAIASKTEAAWDEIEDFAESLQLSQSGELMDGLGQVASTIPDSPGTPTQDWRSMLAVF